MTLLDLLADDLLHWMDAAPDGVPRRVLLWLDPERQFRRLATHLGPVLLARGTGFLVHEASDGVMATLSTKITTDDFISDDMNSVAPSAGGWGTYKQTRPRSTSP